MKDRAYAKDVLTPFAERIRELSKAGKGEELLDTDNLSLEK